MGWVETGKEKAREHIISVIFALIALLLLVIWQAVPASVWGTVSEVTPKRVLWALLGLEAIVIGVQAAFALDNRRKRKHTPLPEPLIPPEPQLLRRYGLFWDGDLNPLCPVDQTMLTYFMTHATGRYDILQCARCGTRFPIHDDEQGNLTLDIAKYEVRQQPR